MATGGEERFLRSSHLLLKGTFYLAKKVLIREAEKVRQQTGRDLNDLLKDNEEKLKHEFRNKRHKEKLFPTSGRTNVEDWDISLLTGVLLLVFRESLPEEDRTAIKMIKYQRNEVYAHCAVASLDESDYTDTCKDLKDAFYRLASGCDSEVKQTCDAIIETCLNGSVDHKSLVEQLKLLSEKDDLLLEIIKKIETTNAIKDTVKDISAIERSIAEVSCDTREELQAAVLEAIQQGRGGPRKTTKVFDSQLDVWGKDKDEETVSLAEDIIVKVTNEALRSAHTSEEYIKIREIIQEIIDEIGSNSGVKLLSVLKGSVIIRFESCSYEQLSRLINFMESIDMKERLNKLADIVSRHMNTKDTLQLSFSLPLKTLESIWDGIANDERKCKKSVHIAIMIASDEGKTRLRDLFKGDGFTHKLQRLSAALTETVRAEINVTPSDSIEVVDDLDHEEEIYEETEESEENGIKRKLPDETSIQIDSNTEKISKQETDEQSDGRLLSYEELRNLVLTEGKTSSIVIKECGKICKFIKEQRSDEIVNVWPGYTLEDSTELVFVVLAKTMLNLKLSHKVHIRVIEQVNEESKRIMYDKENRPLTKEMENKIKSVIDKYSEKLIKDHRFLSAISASSVMYQRQETGKLEIVPAPCIVLYVLVKSVVFLTEETFPEKLDEIPLDVREGVFRFCAGSAGDRHETLRMGCKITSDQHPIKYGTLGGFIEHPHYGLCGFSCAHVFRDRNEMFTLKVKSTMKENDLQKECGVFQPVTGYNNKIGRVVKLIYKEGSCYNDEAGVDAAIIKIEERAPVAGNFPDEGGRMTVLRYESGKVLGKVGVPLRNRIVQKFGFVTGQTHGEIQFTNSVVKDIDFTRDIVNMITPGPNIQIQSTLYKQYHIKSTIEGNAFSKLGDSGALVFVEDELRDLRCIGMVVGVVNSDNSVFVTPITDILREFGVESLLSFNQNVTMSNIDLRLRELEERMQQGLQDKLDGFETRMQGMVQQILQKDRGERSVNENNN